MNENTKKIVYFDNKLKKYRLKKEKNIMEEIIKNAKNTKPVFGEY